MNDPDYINIWNKFSIISQCIIAFVTLLFTALFGYSQLKNEQISLRLTESNTQLAEAQKLLAEEQLKASLIPLLASDNPKQRSIALTLANNLDVAFAAKAATLYAVGDSDQEVREKAHSILYNLSDSQQQDIQQQASKGLNEFEIMGELRRKDLLETLGMVEGGLNLSRSEDQLTAIKIYQKVVAELSPDTRKKLDQNLLREAQSSQKKGFNVKALQKYKALFSAFTQIN